MIKKMSKTNEAYKTIGEVAKILSLTLKRKKNSNYTPLDFGKKNLNKLNQKFLKEIEDIMILKNIELLKKVHFLLKEQGMTINGVKKILDNKEPLKLDELSNHSIKASNLKNKLIKISNIVKSLKNIK